MNHEQIIDSQSIRFYRGLMAEIDKRSDDALIALCLEQDAEAWETLVRRYQRLIATIAIRYGLSTDDSLDVLQFVFFELFQQLAEIYKKQELRAWIVTLTVRECWKLHRKLTSSPNSDPLIKTGFDPTDINGLAQDEEILLLERQHLLRQTVASMSSPCNTLLTELFYRVEPLPYAEISRQLGIPVSSIGPTRARCLSKLRAALKKNGFF